MIGGQIGNYQIVRELGAGGMGTVYEGVHREIGRRAAIKLLHPDRSRDPLMAVRFLNEARAISRVEHPGLVRIFEYGRLQDGAAYLVMEYLAGETLRERLRRSGNGIGPAAIALVRQLALALATIHAKQIVHRDLKPDNVTIERETNKTVPRRGEVLANHGLRCGTVVEPTRSMTRMAVFDGELLSRPLAPAVPKRSRRSYQRMVTIGS